jgi:TonB family protein
MRRILIVLLAFVAPALAQQPPKDVASSIGLIFGMESREMISAAEAMPEDKYDFRPTQGAFTNVRTFAEQIKHVACANFGFAAEIRKQTPPEKCDVGGGPDPSHTKAEILKYLRDSYSQVEQVIRETTPQNMLDGPCVGRYGCPNTRLGVLQVAVWHSGDHYGQVVEYLRMNGIVPPASQPQSQAGQNAASQQTQLAGAPLQMKQSQLKWKKQVPPVYPDDARRDGVQGPVRMDVIFAMDGSVKQVNVIEGHPALRDAAVEAIRQWKCEPYKANGVPTEIESLVTINFNLAR